MYLCSFSKRRSVSFHPVASSAAGGLRPCSKVDHQHTFRVRVCVVLRYSTYLSSLLYGLLVLIDDLHVAGIGWSMLLLSALTSIYYSVIVAYSLYYFAASFSALPGLPWNDCKDDWASKCMTYTNASFLMKLSVYSTICISCV